MDWRRLNCRRLQSSPMCLGHPRFKVYLAKKSETDTTAGRLSNASEKIWREATLERWEGMEGLR